ncbi:MAG: DUF2891 domain-containing protein [Proteobacteria bacterium]|nr:DUF2891 domain-containing protein [Pseudomonadota bacterium]
MTVVTRAEAERWAAVALANVVREYPNHPQHLWLTAADGATPRELHPAFYGSYDWHSCVHMHWLLARLMKHATGIAPCDAITATFDRHLAPTAIAGECAYFARPGTGTFERTYGWAWLLKLAAALRDLGDAAARWRSALAPLVAVIVARYDGYLPRADYPIRHGLHANSAFGLALALDYADACGDTTLAATLRDKATHWYAQDRDAPVRWEPSGTDFLSPALMEAALMRRVLDAGDYHAWLAAFLPGLVDGTRVLAPVRVADRTDPQIVHLDGLNLSRAWSLYEIAAGLPGAERAATVVQARDHETAGREGLASGDYGGAHWLASFAMLASEARAAC